MTHLGQAAGTAGMNWKTHIHNLAQNLKIKIGFLYRIKGCLNIKLQNNCTIMSVMDYGEIFFTLMLHKLLSIS